MKDSFLVQLLGKSGLALMLPQMTAEQEAAFEKLLLFVYKRGHEDGERQEMEYPRRDAVN